MPRFEPLAAIEQCATPEIGVRFSCAPKTKITTCYRVLVGENEEVAFVVIDRWREPHNALVVYELFVTPRFRRQGIGSAILKKIERLADEEAFAKVSLFPAPLEPGTTRSDLTEWYIRRGYVASAANGELEKAIPVI